MKKFLSLLIALTLLLSLGAGASAAGSGKFMHSYYGIDGNELVAFGANIPEGGKYSITFASQTNVNGEMMKVSEAGVATTVYCVVDTSVAIHKQAFDKEIELLTVLGSLMSDNDIMIISTVGEEIKESKPLTTKQQRLDAIEAIKSAGKSTDLYDATKRGLETLTTKKDVTLNKCMLILSDGCDDGKTSVTEQMVLEQIEGTTIPVYAVAVLKDYPESYTLNYTKVLERMSSYAVGGAYYDTSAKGNTAVQIASDIWNKIQSSVVVRVDLRSVDTEKLGDTALLTVKYDTADKHLEDSVTVLTADIPVRPKPVMDEPIPEEPEEEQKLSPVIIGAIGGGALLVIALVVLLIVKLSKKKRTPEVIKVTGPTGEIVDPGITMGVDEPTDGPGITIPLTPTDPVTPIGPVLKVHLSVIGHEDQTFDFELPQKTAKTIGRDAAESDIVLTVKGKEDENLSRCHCEMAWDDNKLFVKDKDSTNGTYVNGAPVVKGSIQVINNGDKLRIGSREFRVKTTVRW